jgi:hypothetical protein
MDNAEMTRRQILLAALAAVAGVGGEEAHAQDPAKVMPRAYRVAFENDALRVLEFTGRPGMGICGMGVHSHPAHLTIVLSDFEATVKGADGRNVKRERKLGDVFWSEAETHEVENVGRTASRVLIVELKPGVKTRV